MIRSDTMNFIRRDRHGSVKYMLTDTRCRNIKRRSRTAPEAAVHDA